MRYAKKLLGPDWLNGYAIAWSFGALLALCLLPLFLFGKIRVRGYWRAFRAMGRGNVILAANHPEGMTPFLIPALFCPGYLLIPRFYPWNVPREGLVPSFLLVPFRCIVVERGNRLQKMAAAKKLIHLLRESGNILIFPEGTRTIDETNPDRELVRMNGRSIRPIKETGVPFIAQSSNARVVPVWIDIPDVTRKLKFWESVAHLLEPGRIGKENFNIDAENARLQNLILTT